MIEIGSFEAKTHLPALLKRVADGESILITRRGKPLAKIVSLSGEEAPVSRLQTIDELLAFGKSHTLNKGRRGKKLSLRTLIDEGRRF